MSGFSFPFCFRSGLPLHCFHHRQWQLCCWTAHCPQPVTLLVLPDVALQTSARLRIATTPALWNRKELQTLYQSDAQKQRVSVQRHGCRADPAAVAILQARRRQRRAQALPAPPQLVLPQTSLSMLVCCARSWWVAESPPAVKLCRAYRLACSTCFACCVSPYCCVLHPSLLDGVPILYSPARSICWWKWRICTSSPELDSSRAACCKVSDSLRCPCATGECP